LSGSDRSKDGATAGFTLIEVLVALGILSISIMSIGSLVAANMRGVSTLSRHLALSSVARTVETRLPDSLQNQSAILSGATDDHAWRVDVKPFTGSVSRSQLTWVPEEVTVTVSNPAGARLEFDTIRLRKSPRQ
jgi:general secretion pathway protein I